MHAFLFSRWTHYGALVLGILLTFLWGRAGWNSAERWETVAGIEKNARETLEAAYRTASDTARANALAAKTAQEQRDERNRENHDHAYRESLTDARRRTDAYARAHRVSGQATTDLGSSGGPDLPRPAFGAQEPDGAGDATVMVAISRADLDICTENSTRLQNAHDWHEAGTAESPAR